MTVAVLFAHHRSSYFSLPGCDVWDRKRDAMKWPGGCPVIAHPPCAQWGRLRGMAREDIAEKSLALYALMQVRRWGGVLEHPAGTTLTDYGLPAPGAIDQFGGWTLEVSQLWWGHRAEKPTWLYFVGVAHCDLPIKPLAMNAPAVIGGSRLRKGGREVTKTERHLTPPDLARWLYEAVRRIRGTR